MNTVIFTIIAYLIGSISFAVVMSRAFGLSDPRTYGSKNPGATNVLRSGNKKAAIATLIGDAVKGWLAVWVAQLVAEQYGVGDAGHRPGGDGRVHRHLYPMVFQVRRRQGRGDRARRVAGHECWMGWPPW